MVAGMEPATTRQGEELLRRFPGMALDTFAYDRPDAWRNSWTLFFWAWWIACRRDGSLFWR